MTVNPHGTYSFEQHRLMGFYDSDDDEFWRGLEDGVLKLPRCAGCGIWRWESVRAIFGAVIARCGECGTWPMRWSNVDLIGLLYGWVRTNQPLFGVEERWNDVPYVTIEVTVAENNGPRVMGLLQGGTDGLRIGATVRGSILPPTTSSKWYPALSWSLDPSVTSPFSGPGSTR
jgi:hypothetical protein